jgi:hypothetical protein
MTSSTNGDMPRNPSLRSSGAEDSEPEAIVSDAADVASSDSSPALVWYASYGSNISRDRFMYYIEGGELNGRNYEGCADHTAPRADTAVMIPHELFFASRSGVWDGAMAFVRGEQGGETLGRMYLITYNQLAQVIRQEKSLPAEGPNICPPLEYMLANPKAFTNPDDPGSPAPGDARASYGQLINLGNHEDGRPILTFTAVGPDAQIKPAAPSKAYLQTIVRGLKEIHPTVTANEVVEYLSKKPGVQGKIAADTLRAWIAEQFAPAEACQ